MATKDRIKSLLIVILVVIISFGGFGPRTEAAPAQTCSSTLLGLQGFDVCFFGSTGNLASSLLASIGNSVWFIQNMFNAGKCFCNQACQPSQIVCENAPIISSALGALGSMGIGTVWNPLANQLAQFVFQLENFNVYCYCPQFVNATTACNRVGKPQLCYPPEPVAANTTSNSTTTGRIAKTDGENIQL